MTAKKKFYAVAKGKQTGIFTDWNTTKALVQGYAGARYKGFATRQEAQSWLDEGEPRIAKAPSKTATLSGESTKEPTEAIVVYTDGGSRNTGNVNGGHVKKQDKAAWAYLIEIAGQQHSDSQGEYGATNNRMEIMALIQALTWLKDNGKATQEIAIVADSRYVLNAIQKNWIVGWKRRGWQRSGNQPLANRELWQELDRLLAQFPHLHYYWTKGHATNAGNVFVDQLLNQTMDRMTNENTQTPPFTARVNDRSTDKTDKTAIKNNVIPKSQQQSVDAIKKSLEKLEWYND